MNRIDALFARLRAEGRRAFMPFITAGDPDLATTAALITEMVARGAHMVEIGIPYSDPIADGPVISASYTRALGKGIKLGAILQMFRTLRAETSGGPLTAAPLVTMVSYAIVHRHGIDRYLRDAAAVGIDGLIVPDLPVEEAGELCERARDLDLSLIQLITPMTPRERALKIAASTTGFIYYVSVAGITGERATLPPELAENVSWLRGHTSLPICIGFGIGKPEHVRALAPVADGLIVGSALVRRVADIGNRPKLEVVREIGQFVAELAQALEGAPKPAVATTPGN
jgi:tryptophan synthase alpha chain